MPATTTPHADEALLARFGATPEQLPDNDVLRTLYAHRSVRQFTADDVTGAEVTAILSAARSTASSSNLQTWSVVEVREAGHKAAAAALAGDQEFIRQAPVFLVFVADWARNARIAAAQGAPSEGVDYLDSTLVSFIDAGIAAQSAVVAAESLGLGTVYVGAVRNNTEHLADLLRLPAGAVPVVGLAIGRPDPSEAAATKPRLPAAAVHHRETYVPVDLDDVDAYERAITAYYGRFGAARGWVAGVLRRVRDARSLHGRELLRGALERRGLPSK